MAAQFCPSCANLLVIDVGVGRSGGVAFRCRTCPYVYKVEEKLADKQVLPRRRVDDILGGEEAWKDVDTTEEQCPRCGHHKAYVKQLQTRSADEPMTNFFRCTKCSHNWKDQ
ncbi:unnamed protein product [Prorocentrum cordatum]|uniref:DNA-directed RNA polymerase subunit n=1 Tax=Prorocentrum cordatum TaxID=2364126 RepID=A0ABN9V4W7_9DINO|nr:unnamed protein product [Polarella glacialis]|mmetsp:Transcript_97850/g.265696  ORF Transcript_97850/g.265696 Transcript_97850/m.265696 type:complete len:112 (+) Transcript_97850:67-402(+)